MGACTKDPKPLTRTDIEESIMVWERFKKTNANSYFFTSVTSSFSSLKTESTIFVANGNIIRKDYYATYRNDNGDWVEERFQETGSNVGQSPQGLAPMTMDDIYKMALEKWLKPDVKAEVVFETDSKGILSKAGYYPEGCRDDCFEGIIIKTISPL
ncbi:hypothetical protein PEDI_15920 [Persicobacter diffluens]|uniref:Uncharacterized protein n=2 Tax=Persicobacter diffluens TaxID=981 RepID=A0AAN4VZ61_9BACT|nr:hypothetical protein PEDI_15920 [Persicobacter diffluens]